MTGWHEQLERVVASASALGKALSGGNAALPSPLPSSAVASVAPQPPGFQETLHSTNVFQRVGADGYLKAIREKTRYGQPVFDRDCMPVLAGLCDLVQLLPATSSRYHTGAGGMLVHALLSANVAMQLRLGEILPRGGASEDVHRREHRWTYGIMLCALFHDLGNLCSDFRVLYRTRDGREKCWHPAAGTLLTMGAASYRAYGASEPGLLGEHAARLPIVFLHQLVPAPVLHWLADDRELMDEMLLSLSGVMSDGAIVQIVRRAHDASVARAASALSPPPAVSAPLPDTNTSASQQEAATRRAPKANLQDPSASAQQDLFEQHDCPGDHLPAPRGTTMATEKPVLAEPLTLNLPSTLTPMVREALAGIFDSVSALGRALQHQYFDETGWFVPLTSLESKGVDPGLALKCLLAEQVIYVGQTGDARKVHTRHIANTDVRGIIVKRNFVATPNLSD